MSANFLSGQSVYNALSKKFSYHRIASRRIWTVNTNVIRQPIVLL